MNAPDLIGVGAIFIDDIVLPDGRTFMAQVGGGVIHALMGAVLWGERPGLCAFAGNDLAPEVSAFLARHLDLRGLITLDIPQARTWQVFEWDGTRRELHRVRDTTLFVAGAQPHHMPEVYEQTKAFYLLQDFDGIRRWSSQVPGLTLWEPNALVMQPENRARFCAALRECPVSAVSPNLQEAQVIYGDLPPDGLVDKMLQEGAKIVALRMGAAGSLVANASARHMIPAVHVQQVTDQTGAGNTYCGAFLLGLLRGKTLLEAGAMGAVAASFCIETVGVLNPGSVDTVERDRRYQWAIQETQNG